MNDVRRRRGRTRGTCLLAALIAALTLAALTTGASANRISLSSPLMKYVWTSARVSGAGTTIACPLTIEGSMHSRTITKTPGLLIGQYITIRWDTSSCTGGTITALTATPYHLTYKTFTGTLPLFGGIKADVVGLGFEITLFGGFIHCLYRSTAAAPATGTFNVDSRGVVTGYRADEGASIPLASGAGVCPASVTISGTAAVTVPGSGSAVTMTLI